MEYSILANTYKVLLDLFCNFGPKYDSDWKLSHHLDIIFTYLEPVILLLVITYHKHLYYTPVHGQFTSPVITMGRKKHLVVFQIETSTKLGDSSPD
jgi:hypothetical protein